MTTILIITTVMYLVLVCGLAWLWHKTERYEDLYKVHKGLADKVGQDIAVIRGDIHKLIQRTDDLQKQIDDLQKQINAAGNSIETLRTDQAGNLSRFEQLCKQINTCNELIGANGLAIKSLQGSSETPRYQPRARRVPPKATADETTDQPVRRARRKKPEKEGEEA